MYFFKLSLLQCDSTLYRSLHNPYNTEKAELTSIFVSGYIHTYTKFTSIYGSHAIQSALQGLCKLLVEIYPFLIHAWKFIV